MAAGVTYELVETSPDGMGLVPKPREELPEGMPEWLGVDETEEW